MGLFDTTVKTFEVYNQPLFAYPDTSDMSSAIIFSILRDEPMDVHLKRAMTSSLNMGHIRKCNRWLGDGTYSPGYGEVGVKLNLVVSSELQAAFSSEHPGYTAEWVHAGTPSLFDWVTSYLSNDPNQYQNEFTYINCIAGNVEENFVNFGDPSTGGIIGGTIVGVREDSNGTMMVQVEYYSGGDSGGYIISEFSTDAPPLPTSETWYIAGGFGNGGGCFIHFRYRASDGTYQELEDIDIKFGSVGDVAECFPPIPVRVKNVNYNESGSGLDGDEIEKILGIFNIRPEDILTEIEDSDDAPDMDMMDNIFSTFNVRVWDESEAGRQYLYTFFHHLLEIMVDASAHEAHTECLETIQDLGDECTSDECDDIPVAPECNSVAVRTKETDFKLYFSAIENVYYTLSDIADDQDLTDIFNSDTGTFHSSSGALLVPAGYTAMRQSDVQAWLDGGGVRSNRTISEGVTGWDWLKPAVRISDWPGTIYEADGSVSSAGELITEKVYEKHGSGIKMRPAEPDEDVRSITYYSVTPSGIDAITVYGLGGEEFVEDTETNETRKVFLPPNETNKLTVPFMFGLIENIYDNGQMHDKVDALVCSLHITVLVADITTTRTPWWMVLLKIVGFVIAIVLMYFPITSAAGVKLFGVMTTVGITFVAISLGVIMYVVMSKVFEILGEVSPWLAFAAAVIMAIRGNWSTLANLATVSLSQILITALNIVMLAIKGLTTYESVSLTKEMELMDDELTLLEEDAVGDVEVGEFGQTVAAASIAPVDPQEYFDRVDGYHEIGFSLFDYDSMYGVGNELPGMGI